MKCRNCGNDIDMTSSYCPYCGIDLKINNDQSSFLIALLSFMFPIIGIILYVILHKDYPNRAKSALKGTVIGFISGFVLVILFYLFVFSFFFI